MLYFFFYLLIIRHHDTSNSFFHATKESIERKRDEDIDVRDDIQPLRSLLPTPFTYSRQWWLFIQLRIVTPCYYQKVTVHYSCTCFYFGKLISYEQYISLNHFLRYLLYSMMMMTARQSEIKHETKQNNMRTYKCWHANVIELSI